MEELVSLLKKRKYTIASIESLTAGLFASTIAEVSGASAVLKGGLVTYQTACKLDVLGISPDIVSSYGVISKETVLAMAQKGYEMFQSDIVVSFSGNAGPDVMEGKDVGLVHMAICFHQKMYEYAMIFKGSRNEVRRQAVCFMCEKLKEIINF